MAGWGTGGYGTGGYGGSGVPIPAGTGPGWGVDPWGTAPWGSFEAEAPTLYAVSPGIIEVEGGTVVSIFGENFFPEFVPQVLLGGVVQAEGYLFDPNFDLEPDRAIAGLPALPAGTYDLRVKTPAGLSSVLAGALIYKPHADETIIQKGRSNWSAKWRTGRRLRA